MGRLLTGCGRAGQAFRGLSLRRKAQPPSWRGEKRAWGGWSGDVGKRPKRITVRVML